MFDSLLKRVDGEAELLRTERTISICQRWQYPFLAVKLLSGLRIAAVNEGRFG
jgi:hypothetical protein